MNRHLETKDSSVTAFVANVLHDLKKSLRGEPHTFEEIVHSLEAAKNRDVSFIALLETHHEYLKESIVVLMDKDSSKTEKQIHLSRFIRLVEMHGKAEQETLYQNLRSNLGKEARLEGLAGQDEHELAYQLANELRGLHFESSWSEDIEAKAKVIAGMVLNHIREEEAQMFSIAKRDMTEDELNSLTPAYIDRCRNYLDLSSKFSRPSHSLNS